MPTYEYACTSCGDHLEVVQSFRDDPLTDCPACGGGLRKVFGSIGVVFKGSGFYKTDSRSSSKPSTAAEAKEAKAAGSSTDSSSDSKSSEASVPSTTTPAKSKAKDSSKPSGTSSAAAS